MSDATDVKLRQDFLGGMSHAACTVNVVTTDGAAGHAGVTISAMASVCLHHLSPAASPTLENGVFRVNSLRDDQSNISETFAGRFKTQVADKLDCARWTVLTTDLISTLPILRSASVRSGTELEGVGPPVAMRPMKEAHAIAVADRLEPGNRHAGCLERKCIASAAIVDSRAAASAVVEPLDAGHGIVVPEHRSGR